MLLNAGALSLALLLASRLLGLLRESALAATFGTSGLADVAVLMLTLPDWLTGVLASGALAYVLVPAWASQGPAQVARTQRRVGRTLLLAGVGLALTLVFLREPAVAWLAPGLPLAMRGVAAHGLIWSAAALPAALLAALWGTRLQHERDFIGMYSGSLVVNVSLLVAIAGASLAAAGTASVSGLGIGLLLAAGLRLGWLRWRQQPVPEVEVAGPKAPLPDPAVWVWAVLSASLPLALPFLARSMASQTGEGALATFNYAWKLVELPLLLAIQLVATLAFPAIARALSGTGDSAASTMAGASIRLAFALAFVLACASTAGLLAGAPALTQLLFGWGRMEPQALERVAQWGRIGAWGLLPQALIAVALTILAAQGRMRAAVLAYGVALAGLLAAGAAGIKDGAAVMMTLNVLLAGVAAVSVAATGPVARRWLPWRVLLSALAALLVVAMALWLLPSPRGVLQGVALAALCAALVLGSAWLAAGELRGSSRAIIPAASYD